MEPAERRCQAAGTKEALDRRGRGQPSGRRSLGLTVLTLNLIAQLTSAAMNLPDGIENILGFVPRSTFQCERDGYFGDIDNDCRIFHLCQRQVNPNGRVVSIGETRDDDGGS